MKTIIVTISPTGQTQLETRGYAGAGCRTVSRDLEAALGDVVADQPTAEFYAAAPPERITLRILPRNCNATGQCAP